MDSNRQNKRSRQRQLTREEHALWHQISQHVKPLQSKFSLSKALSSPTQKNAGIDKAGTRQTPSNVELADSKKATVAAGPANRASGKSRFAHFDQNLSKKIGKGRTTIDARLDLHGMRQDEAKAELRRFLFSCLSKGHKIVLVITGKGEAPKRDIPWDSGQGVSRGILKRVVPLWLREPEFSVIIVSYTSAHMKHGGDGALYIHLKRKGRS